MPDLALQFFQLYDGNWTEVFQINKFMATLPLYVPVLFVVTFLTGLWIFSRASQHVRWLLVVLIVAAVLQTVLTLSGFYVRPELLTQRFPVLAAPLSIFFALLFAIPRGRRLIDMLDIRFLTILHVIRIGVEIVLLELFLHKGIPQAMTFEGRNFDVLSGLTAPVVYYFGFVQAKIGRWVMIAWNLACLLLLINVVSTAFLSLPGRYASHGFEQPAIAVAYFPFSLLPSVLVPLVLFSNAAAIRQLLKFRTAAA